MNTWLSLLRKAITDLVRVPDARMSGTGSIHLEVDDAALASRRKVWAAPPTPWRGWTKLYCDHVLQADQGADLDFLVGSSGSVVPRDSH